MPTGQSDASSSLPIPSPSAAVSMEPLLQSVMGIGRTGAQSLARLNLFTVRDLLRYYPRRWEDRTSFRSSEEVENGAWASFYGVVISTVTKRPRPRIAVTEVVINDRGSALKLVWFNQPYLEKTFITLVASRATISVYGQIKRTGWTPEIHSPEWEEINGDTDPLSINRIVPVYRSTEGIRQTRLRRYVNATLDQYGSLIEDPIPSEVVLQHALIGCEAAIRNIHFPKSAADLDAARRRLIFEEFFLFQVLVALKRHSAISLSGAFRLDVDLAKVHASIRELVPFELTRAQRGAIREISEDLTSGRCMNRLLQGDVGSGKTMVALAAMLMAVENGFQAALMAPTEILAQQHAQVFRKLLFPSGIAVELASGSQTKKERLQVRNHILGGQSRIVIGTHALIQDDVKFANLGLVIIDEQHRFGVLQRQALAHKGRRPHVLVMTATPIPRTMTLTLYGDLDVSVLDELPPGRKPITTHWKPVSGRQQVYQSARRLLDRGHQLYVVCPLIEESEKLQAASATQLAEQISQSILPEYRVGLLHGQMKPDEKDEVMARFKAHELDILVATTVIEVGIDVPNASVIIIEDADRFGLAQLHQLRGRVGRGSNASYCILIGEPRTEVGRARLDIMTQSCDGFVIAEADLNLRGPGEFYGTKQSGVPEFQIADILRDQMVLTETREAALALVHGDPLLEKTSNLALKAAIAHNLAGFSLATVS